MVAVRKYKRVDPSSERKSDRQLSLNKHGTKGAHSFIVNFSEKEKENIKKEYNRIISFCPPITLTFVVPAFALYPSLLVTC